MHGVRVGIDLPEEQRLLLAVPVDERGRDRLGCLDLPAAGLCVRGGYQDAPALRDIGGRVEG